MKILEHTLRSIVVVSLMVVAGCASMNDASKSNDASKPSFIYKDIPVATRTVLVGSGSTVIFRGTTQPLSGSSLKLGDFLRNANVVKRDLAIVDLHDTKGKVRIISVVPSVDTKVCEQQTHYLSEKNKGLDANVELITVSIDTPFAQDRFAKEAKISNVTFLSDYRNGEFGKAHGLLLHEPHILARSVIVVDRDNVIRYMQVTPEIGHMPDMEAAFDAARALVNADRRL